MRSLGLEYFCCCSVLTPERPTWAAADDNGSEVQQEPSIQGSSEAIDLRSMA